MNDGNFNLSSADLLRKFALLPTRLKAQWAMTWLADPAFHSELRRLFSEPNDRLNLLSMMSAALQAVIDADKPEAGS